MTNIIRVRLIKMPMAFRAFTKEDKNGEFNIYINDRLSEEATARAYEHELAHIKFGDFQRQELAHIFDK